MRSPAHAAPLAMWGGVECTVNRVGERYLDQLERGGHARRLEDLDLVASLGIRTVRYPVLWERVAPDGVDRADWRWTDERLGRLRALGVEPIAGLVHHGSGPRTTSLVDPGFPAALARYARAAAERYPWVRRWTPINEPLTTARFSALYGHWYPHLRDGRAFARAVVGQCRAIALAMREIRRVNPDAELVQTEDLGKTYSTPALQEQAEFENVRRWLCFDLLCGMVDEAHPMWDELRRHGIAERELAELRDEPCPPDVVGVNHYLTSERFLDERLDDFPPATHGGNGRQAYADVEAVRALPEGIGGPRAVLAEAWARYGRPLVVTEAHLACTREQQLRWLHEVWTSAQALRAEGADVRAVTAWSLFGAMDWHNLVTRPDGVYEPGAFDARATRPRPTALATMVRDLARDGAHEHPVLAEPGWWRRDERLLYAPCDVRGERESWQAPAEPPAGRPLLVVGATGTLGRAFARLCDERQLAYRATTRGEMDVADAAGVARTLDEAEPWAVVNAAGFVRVDDAEREEEACRRENADGAAVLADACASRGIGLLTFSSDLVFDGARAEPYVERDPVRPLGAYGRSKAEAERRVLARLPAALVVRTSAFFGPWDEHNFLAAVLRALDDETGFRAAHDQVVSPTYVPDLVHAALDLLIDGERGIWHLANRGAASWFDLARRAAEAAGRDPALVEACETRELGLAAVRPRYSALGSERGAIMPTLDDALARWAAAVAAPAVAA